MIGLMICIQADMILFRPQDFVSRHGDARATLAFGEAKTPGACRQGPSSPS